VYSEYYYKFQVKEEDANKIIDIGLHQKDRKIFGFDDWEHNYHIDIQILILKIDNSGINLYYNSENEIKRDLEISIKFEEGTYIVLPRTTGCYMEIKKDERNKVPYIIKMRGKWKLHPYLESAIDEIFRQYDFNMDGLLNIGKNYAQIKLISL